MEIESRELRGHCMHLNRWVRHVWTKKRYFWGCCRCGETVYSQNDLKDASLASCQGKPVTDHKTPELIFICIPAGDGRIGAGAVQFALQATMQNMVQDKYKFSTFLPTEIRGYARMRNLCVKLFLESPCDRLWFFDEDVVPHEKVFNLLEVDADIAFAPYPAVETFNPVLVKLKDLNRIEAGPSQEGKEGPIRDIHGCGMGCTIIKRRVLEDRHMWYSTKYSNRSDPPTIMDLADDPDSLPPIFRYHFKPDGGPLMGEDHDFGIRASRLGYSIKCDLRIVNDHMKFVALNDARKIINQENSEAKLKQVQDAVLVQQGPGAYGNR